MIDLDNQTTLNIHLTLLEKIGNSLSTKEIELVIVDESTMQELNHQYRNKNYITDVLSFPIEKSFKEEPINSIPLGTIVICASLVEKEAQNFSHTIQDELSLLFIHGLLHLLGFDHETDNGEMRQKEKVLIELFNLPKSLIIRTQE